MVLNTIYNLCPPPPPTPPTHTQNTKLQLKQSCYMVMNLPLPDTFRLEWLMMGIGDVPLMGGSQLPVKGDAHLSPKWRTCFDFLGPGAPTQASNVQAMLVHALYLTFGKLSSVKNNLQSSILEIKIQSTPYRIPYRSFETTKN
jgi:hypothetical protein